jgi:tetratricopeptide (TPR) repeat protein
MKGPNITGTIFIGRWYMTRKAFWDPAALYSTAPAARFGNLFVYRGTFYLPGLLASDSYWAAINKMYAPKPDLAEAERLFRQSVQLDPAAYFVYIDLGNLALGRGAREEALSQYQEALHRAPNKILSRPVEEQIQRFSGTTATSQIPSLRDPNIE